MIATIFPGQGAQFIGMGKELYNQHTLAKELFDKANEILQFNITDLMFSGTEEALKQTKVTQPALFLHSVILAACTSDFAPEMVAGHSLGEFSALTAAKALSFEEGLRLVITRAQAMQKACEAEPSTMAVVMGLSDDKVEEICASISGTVVPANYNCPGQLVISGTIPAVEAACEALKAAGAKRALRLAVSGAFHSPLMEPAIQELTNALQDAHMLAPICPIYQNVDARPHTNPQEIKQNLVMQLTAPVRWAQSVQNMVADGATQFIELGPGNVLQGLVRKIAPQVQVEGRL